MCSSLRAYGYIFCMFWLSSYRLIILRFCVSVRHDFCKIEDSYVKLGVKWLNISDIFLEGLSSFHSLILINTFDNAYKWVQLHYQKVLIGSMFVCRVDSKLSSSVTPNNFEPHVQVWLYCFIVTYHFFLFYKFDIKFLICLT